jgi:thiamine kinase-like enzyme
VEFVAGLGAGAWAVTTGDGTALVAARASEPAAKVAQIAGERGVGPRVVTFGDGWLVAERLQGRHVTALELRRPMLLREVADLLVAWHSTPLPAFGDAIPRADLARSLRRYVEVADALPGRPIDQVCDRLRVAVGWAEQTLADLTAGSSPMVGCHLDTVANLIDTDEGLRLVDFDFAARASAGQELGQLIWEAELDRSAAEVLVDRYRGIGGGVVADAATWCVVAGVTWTAWGLGMNTPTMTRYSRRCWERLATHWAMPDELRCG